MLCGWCWLMRWKEGKKELGSILNIKLKDFVNTPWNRNAFLVQPLSSVVYCQAKYVELIMLPRASASHFTTST